MNATDEKIIEDYQVNVPEPAAVELIPRGMYNVRLVKFKREPKPDWKFVGVDQTALTADERDQFVWGFEIIEGPHQGFVLYDFTNITWHPKSNAHKYAAALMGVPEIEPGTGFRTSQLAGRTCTLVVIEQPGVRNPNVIYNSIDRAMPIASAAQTSRYREAQPRNKAPEPPPMDNAGPGPAQARPAPSKQTMASPTVKRVDLEGYPHDDPDDIPF